jgi:hypothetical protein
MKRLLDLNLEECRWPVPLQGPNSRLFCAERTPRRGLPYCETTCAARTNVRHSATARSSSEGADALARLPLGLLQPVPQRLGTFDVFGKSKPRVNKPENDDPSLLERTSDPFDIWPPPEKPSM